MSIPSLPYSIEEHRHRFAAWAAGRAANVNGCRFTVQQGKNILEVSGLKQILSKIEYLPLPDQIDSTHKIWRLNVIAAANDEGLLFTHGVAAKLINIYLKAGYVCAGHHHNESVRALHPPIDSVLLDELAIQNIGQLCSEWNKARKIRWSKFTSDQYEAVIQNIRTSMPGVAMWEVEHHWRGYQ